MQNYQRVGVVIIKDNKVLLIHRIKKGHEYYCFPGGHQDPGETPEQTAIRELKEEASIDIVLDKVLCELDEPDGRGRGIYYLCTEFTGTVKLGGEELERNCPKNSYRFEWIDLEKLSTLTLYPKVVVQSITN